MKLRVYQYSNCGTCRKALKLLSARGIDFVAVPIRETPPTKGELRQMLDLYGGNVKKLFNTSSKDYQALNLSQRLRTLDEDAAIELLSSHGNLVKRPFVLSKKGGAVGFDEDEWDRLLG